MRDKIHMGMLYVYVTSNVYPVHVHDDMCDPCLGLNNFIKT